MKKTIITISREFGSGGRTIGHQVAEKLGYAYYDTEQNRGTITDKEGRFSLSTNQVFDSIHVSCIGYKTQHIKVDRQKKLVILLSENVIQMNNFDFKAGENPAFAILKKVHEKMTDNNPQHYSSYKCKYYSKSIFSSDVIIDR